MISPGLCVVAFDANELPAPDPRGLLQQVEGLSFGTVYPGGIYVACYFDVPAINSPGFLPFVLNNRLVVFDGILPVWEGDIRAINTTGDRLKVSGIGRWASAFMKNYIYKWWADERIDQNIWQLLSSGGGNAMNMCTFDRFNRLGIVPKNVAFANGDNAGYVYTAPSGQTIARIEFTYDFAEAAQNWALELRDITNASTPISITATGTASTSHDFSPTSSQIQLRLRSLAAQTPADDGSIRAIFSSIRVFAEWEGSTPTVAEGTINLQQIAYDILDWPSLSGRISDDTERISSPGTTVAPFVTEKPMPIADVLNAAAAFSNSLGTPNPWAVYLESSFLSTDKLPVLVAKAYPVSDAFDWLVSWDDVEIQDGSGLDISIDEMANFAWVSYKDSLGRETVRSGDTDAALKDDDSIDLYYRLEKVLTFNTGPGGQAEAVRKGQRMVEAKNFPQYQVSPPIAITGTVRNANGALYPVYRVRAGERIKFGNFLNDTTDQRFIFLIAATQYDDESGTIQITVGQDPTSLGANADRLNPQKGYRL